MLEFFLYAIHFQSHILLDFENVISKVKIGYEEKQLKKLVI